MKTSLTNDYLAEVIVKEDNGDVCLVNFKGSTPGIVQNLVSTVMKERSRIQGSNIFSGDHFEGEAPIGWTGNVQLAEPLGVKARVQQTLTLLTKAA